MLNSIRSIRRWKLRRIEERLKQTTSGLGREGLLTEIVCLRKKLGIWEHVVAEEGIFRLTEIYFEPVSGKFYGAKCTVDPWFGYWCHEIYELTEPAMLVKLHKIHPPLSHSVQLNLPRNLHRELSTPGFKPLIDARARQKLLRN